MQGSIRLGREMAVPPIQGTGWGGGQVHGVTRNAYSLSGVGREEVMPAQATVAPSDERHAFLAADVGGTHARVGLVAFEAGQHAPTVLASHIYRCAEYASLDAIVHVFCNEFAVKPQRLALACAGFLHKGAVVNSNLSWPIVPAAIEKTLGLDEVKVLNDFEALAHATAYLDANSVTPLHVPQSTSEQRPEGPVVVVGPGTGLGVAVRLPGLRTVVLATEAGHIQLSARVGREQQIVNELAEPDTHIPYERVLSGPGLLRVYQALCRIEGQPAVFETPSAVTEAACADEDALAVESLHVFCGWLGSFAGDLAMLYGASGGIYMAGGFLSRMTDFALESTFISRFLDKGVMRPFLQTVPVCVVDHGLLGVIGAASRLIDSHAHDQTA